MRTNVRNLSPLAIAAVAAAIISAPTANAVPDCVNVGPYTTQCQTGGSAQISTTPRPMNYGWGWGFGWGGWGWGWGWG